MAVAFSPEFLAVLKENLTMSPETWRKVIAADPTGWRGMLSGNTQENADSGGTAQDLG